MENNVTYDFVVTAVSNAGAESDFSNEVSIMNGEIINEEVIIDNVSLTRQKGKAEEFSPPPFVFRDHFLLTS